MLVVASSEATFFSSPTRGTPPRSRGGDPVVGEGDHPKGGGRGLGSEIAQAIKIFLRCTSRAPSGSLSLATSPVFTGEDEARSPHLQ
jgi:hypothetical protein